MRRKWLHRAASSSPITTGPQSFGLWCASPATRLRTAVNVLSKRLIGYPPEDRWTPHAICTQRSQCRCARSAWKFVEPTKRPVWKPPPPEKSRSDAEEIGSSESTGRSVNPAVIIVRAVISSAIRFFVCGPAAARAPDGIAGDDFRRIRHRRRTRAPKRPEEARRGSTPPMPERVLARPSAASRR